jgi:putative flavoprotein involved in K+ transport
MSDAGTDQSMHDVIIVGAGPAGIGVAVALREVGVHDILVLDRHEVGASFKRWPREMRFITPSFTSNAFGLLDLNAIVAGTSPAYTLDQEHPSGEAYAAYLATVAEHFEVPLQAGVNVRMLLPQPDGTFEVQTDEQRIRARHVIWAAGEFQYPDRLPFPGAEHCRHNADVTAWADLEGDRFTIIGGYESAIDAAVALARRQRSVTVVSRTPAWDNDHPDPSISLSPFTRERLDWAVESGMVDLVGDAEVTGVAECEAGYAVTAADGRSWESATKPIIATGFVGSLGYLEGLVERDDEGTLVVSEEADESTLVPGLFVVGSQLVHRGVRFCFIYKFRQRFGVVAASIAERLGHETEEAIAAWRDAGMYLDDLSCCEESCAC